MKKTHYILSVILIAGLLTGCGAESIPETVPDETREISAQEEVTLEESSEETTLSVPEEESAEAIPETYWGYTISAVNVRTGPSTEFDVFCVLDAHSVVQILKEKKSWISIEEETQPDWYTILLEGEEYYISAAYVRPVATDPNGYVIAIDAGHQSQGNYNTEPNGPGSSTMKAKVSSGTQGRTTGLPEYELNLQVALKLQQELEYRGYTVIMVRTTNDVDISNSERAQIANEAEADAFIRIHANGSENRSVNGAMTICQTKSNPYNGSLYESARALADCVLDAFVAATGCNKQYVWETDTMSGINWCQVPAIILEMGYMTNPDEDQKMATAEYQYQMVQGIANGIEDFLSGETE